MRYEMEDDFFGPVKCDTSKWPKERVTRALSLAREMGYDPVVNGDMLEIYTDEKIDMTEYWKVLDKEAPMR